LSAGPFASGSKSDILLKGLAKYLTIGELDGNFCLPISPHTLLRYGLYRIAFNEWAAYRKTKAEWVGYLDLTAGPGYSRLKPRYASLYGFSQKQIAASPFIAYDAEFSRWILIEKNSTHYLALRNRFEGQLDRVSIFNKDAIQYAPYALRQIRGPCLVCVDPYKPTDITAEILKNLFENKLCDIVGVLPAPGYERAKASWKDRLYVKGLDKHLPFISAEDPKREFCEWSTEQGRHVISWYVSPSRPSYQVILASDSLELLDRVRQKVAKSTISEYLETRVFECK
jgi:hypothetical protein